VTSPTQLRRAAGRAAPSGNAAPAAPGALRADPCCDAGFGDCDGNAANGCEVDLTQRPGHCGACGNACSLPNATPVCAAGACAVGRATRASPTATARPPTAARSTPAHDRPLRRLRQRLQRGHGAPSCAAGACSHRLCRGLRRLRRRRQRLRGGAPRRPAAHCGRCGRSCAPANATPACSAGVCGYGACNAGFADCDGNRPTAARWTRGPPSLTAAPAAARAAPPTRRPPARGRVRRIACSAGFADCDGNGPTAAR
jgi:hypothetical protein